MKQTNADLFNQLNKQGKRTDSLRGAQNDAEQHGHKRNVRVYNISESRPDEPETEAVFLFCFVNCRSHTNKL